VSAVARDQAGLGRLAEPRWLVVSAERLMVSVAQLAVFTTFEEMPRPEDVEVVVESGWLGRVYVVDRDALDRDLGRLMPLRSCACGDPGDCEGCIDG
jgi:hypothetical protein